MIVADTFPSAGFRALVQEAPDGIVVVGADGTILLANAQIQRMTGFSGAELVGAKIEALVPPAVRHRHAAHRDDYAASPHSRPMASNLELAAQCKDGSQLPVEIMLSPVVLEGQRATIAFVRDVTEGRRRRRELEEANAAANAANKELEAFSYSVAHDLRAPLRSIDGFTQAVIEDHGDQLGDDGLEHLGRVRAAAQRMGALIDDLLALARLSRAELRREPVELARLVRDAEQRLRALHPDRRVELTVASPLRAEADARMLTVVLDNLLGNAWKFTRPRAIAHVDVGRDGKAFFVRDDGVGFDPQYAGALFTPFKRLHAAREFEGTGIGLATVARVIHRHGGRIWAESSPGAGATFYFTLEPEDAP